jgi:hypothetical protein
MTGVERCQESDEFGRKLDTVVASEHMSPMLSHKAPVPDLPPKTEFLLEEWVRCRTLMYSL